MERLILELGCGRKKSDIKDGKVIGIDLSTKTDADLVNNLEIPFFPFKRNSFDEILCYNVLEHIHNFLKVMEEIHRVGKPGAIVKIHVPYFSGCDAHVDPTHVRSFTSRSFQYFTGHVPELDFYADCKFKLRKRRINFWEIVELGGIRPQQWIGLGLFANHFTSIYERFFAYIFPAQNIYYELEIDKS